MPNAQDRGWGNPDSPGFQKKNIITIRLACGVKLNVHRQVAHLFEGFFNELEAVTGYSLADQGQPDDWGYVNRDIRGRPGVKSNHSWGLAVDANAEENPMQDTLKTNMPPQTAALASKWGLRWGASYTGRKDAMHFEFEGTPADVKKYPNNAATPQVPPKPTHPEEDDMPYDIHYYKIRDEANPSKEHPTKGGAIWKTDETFTHAVSYEAWVHMLGMGWREDRLELIPETLHDWFVQNNKDGNEG